MSDALSIGKQLVDLCKQGKNLKAIDKLYDAKIVSVENMDMPDMPRRMEGIKAIRGKNEWWLQNHEIHDSDVKGPWPHGDQFIVFYSYDVTPTAGPHKGQRMKMDETALYSTRNGKIVEERFFYHMG